MSAPAGPAPVPPVVRTAAILRDLLPYLGLALLILYFALASDFFLNARNFQRLATDSATLMIVAAGMTLVILLVEIDLSVGAVTALLAVVMAQIMAGGAPWPVAVAAALALSTAIGTLSGAITVLGGIHSFVTTLGMNAVATGLAYILTGSISVAILDETFLDLFYSVRVLGVPVPLVLVVLVYLAVLVLLLRTAFGRSITAIGANAAAARLSGLPVRRDRILVFAIMGLLVGIGAVLSAARLGSGAPGSVPALTLDAIAAVIIGGASLFGGRASVIRTALGALIIAVLNNGMVLLNVNADAQYIVKGVIILVAVVLERIATGARA